MSEGEGGGPVLDVDCEGPGVEHLESAAHWGGGCGDVYHKLRTIIAPLLAIGKKRTKLSPIKNINKNVIQICVTRVVKSKKSMYEG